MKYLVPWITFIWKYWSDNDVEEYDFRFEINVFGLVAICDVGWNYLKGQNKKMESNLNF